MKHISDTMSLAEITDHDFDFVAAEPSGRRKNLHDISGQSARLALFFHGGLVNKDITGSAIPSRRSS
jgi:hypothetical protein